jgi:hypothetical protein
MTRFTKILGTTLAVWLALAAAAAAATLTVSSNVLSAGNAAVSSCGVSSLTASRVVDNNGGITEVDVASIPLACQGQTLSVTLADTTGAALASYTTTLAGCTSTCAASFTGLGGTISAASLKYVSFALVGS